MAKKLSYTEAVEKLETILAELENSADINMELIAAKVKRAALLIDTCKKQLKEIDTDLERILEELE